MFRTTRRRLPLVVASAACGSLLLAGPANAACIVTTYDDDRSAELSHDHDYGDDTSIKRLLLGAGAVAPTSATLTMQGVSYGGCGLYELRVNGVSDHTFGACGAWQSQAMNPLLVRPGLNTFEILDIDFTWDSGIFFDVDTSRSGASVMSANGIPKTGELMWSVTLHSELCV